MNIVMVPALLALAFKLYVVGAARSSRGSKVFFGMVLVFAAHNLTEVVGYIQFANGSDAELSMRIYYAATICMLAYMCLYAIEISRVLSLKKLVIPTVTWMVVATVIVLFTDKIVAGSYSIQYAVTAIKGPWYWVFVVDTVVSLVFVMTLLIFGYRRSESHRVQIQCLYNLVALSPIILLGFILVPLMMMGNRINAAGLLPICTTLFLLVNLQSESRHRFTDIRRFLPFSQERKTSLQVRDLISRFSMDEISYKEMSEEIEKIALTHKMDQADHSVSEAARLLKMKRTTLYSMLERHGIKK